MKPDEADEGGRARSRGSIAPAGHPAGADDPVLGDVLTSYGFDSEAVVERAEGGLINRTYIVRSHRDAPPSAVIQRLHPIFAAQVNLDIDVVTRHLARAGLETPRLLYTRAGARWVSAPHEPDAPASAAPRTVTWRALSYVAGVTLHRLDSVEAARSAGALVGRFHRALADLEHTYAFSRAGVHDTAAHLARLRAALAPSTNTSTDTAASPDAALLDEARELGREILAMADSLPPLGSLPARHSHGDLKISNLLFSADDPHGARCLVDLDTLGPQTIAYELGDAMRSWCNPQGEDVTCPQADEDLFAAAMAGYLATTGDLLCPAERAAIVPGWETVCVELAARFCVDVFDDRYFGWNSSRYLSRRAHNLARARGQLALALSVRQKRGLFDRLA